MKIAVIFLLWMLVGDRIGHSVTGRMCTFRISDRGVQLNYDRSTCQCTTCRLTSTIGHFNNYTERQLSHCHCQELTIICPTGTIPQYLEALSRNPSIQQEISKIFCPSSSNIICNSPPTDSDIPITAPASPISSNSLPTVMNKTGQPGESLIVTSLGALVGILLILLAVVITGWMWTCRTMRQRERNKTNSEQVRTVQNTAYGVIVPANHSSTGQLVSSNNDQLGNTSQTGGLQGRDIENNYHLMDNNMEEEGGKSTSTMS